MLAESKQQLIMKLRRSRAATKMALATSCQVIWNKFGDKRLERAVEIALVPDVQHEGFLPEDTGRFLCVSLLCGGARIIRVQESGLDVSV
jgi:hypothetical protein